MFVIVYSLCFLPFSKYFKLYILLMNIYTNASTHISFKNCSKNHTLPCPRFIANEKILYVKLVWVVYTAQHIFMSHFIFFFFSSGHWSINLSRVYTSNHLTYKACAATILDILYRVKVSRVSAQIHCCLTAQISHQKVIILRIIMIIYFMTSNSISFCSRLLSYWQYKLQP